MIKTSHRVPNSSTQSKSDSARSRNLLVTLQSEHEIRIVLERRGEILSQGGVFRLPVLTKDDAFVLRENKVLQTGRQLVDEAVPRQKSNSEIFKCSMMGSR